MPVEVSKPTEKVAKQKPKNIQNLGNYKTCTMCVSGNAREKRRRIFEG